MRAQYKIMQMVFMVLFIFLFFILVGIFLINSQSQGIKESAESLKRMQTISLIESLANSPEFSCGGTNSWCIDKDKLKIMSGELGETYSDFWQIASIEVLTIYPNNNTEVVECPANECNYYKIYDKDPDHFDQKTLDGFIPPRLINNSDLNYDDMFKKMNNEDLTNLLKYFKSIYKK